jgi:hypothetical protein
MAHYGYDYDPATMYQPALPDVEFVTSQNGVVVVHRDGTVTSDVTIPWHETVRGYNSYVVNGSCYTAYKTAATALWPNFPPNLKVVDHINRDRSCDAWENLRKVDVSLNNLNRYIKGTKGYIHETKEWRDKVNACRARKNQPPLYLKEPCRNKYVSCLTYKGNRYEFGCFDDPESATAEYLAQKENFIQDRLREYWSSFLFA